MTNKTHLGALLALTLATACGETDVILPGERFDIRDATVPIQNESRPISLPSQQANANWTHRSGGPDHRIGHPALSTSPSEVFAVSIGEGDSAQARITADPVVAGGVIYTLDARAQVTATATNGTQVWTHNLTPGSDGRGDASGGGIAVGGGRVYVTTGFGEVTALDAGSGGEIWTQDLDAVGTSAPTVLGELVYVVGRDNTGWALEIDNGRIRWQIGATPTVGGFAGGAGAAVNSEIAIFPFNSGEVIGAFPQGGLRRWSTVVGGERLGSAAATIGDIAGDPVIVGTTVYVGNVAGRVVALDTGSGERLWTARDGAVSPVFPAGGSLFLVNDVNELVRLDASDGTPIWRVALPRFVESSFGSASQIVAHYGPVLAGGRLLVAASDGQIRQFDPTSGALVGAIPIAEGAASHPVVAGQTLYVVSKAGRLHAFR